MLFSSRSASACLLAVATCTAATISSPAANAEALLLVEVDSGRVLHAENATYPWYPASVTKIMTAYVLLRAVKEGRITLDTPFTVSANAARQQPTKMGFKPGTVVTVDNALKMILVKSANDVAVMLAEGLSGSVENFADEMNRTARRLGMTQSHFVNPHGLPADEQVSSARDLAILARTVLREFPGHDHYWRIPAIRYGKRTMRNHNRLIGRYPGTDGMKTGYICAAGFNVIATATRHGKRLIAVVLGAPSSRIRSIKAAQLLERGFNTGPLSWLTPSLGNVQSLIPISASPPNLREEICGRHRRRQASEENDDDDDANVAGVTADSPYAIFLSSLRAPDPKPADLLQSVDVGPPIVVHTGAPKNQSPTRLSSAGAGEMPAPAKPAQAAAAPWTSLSPSSLASNPPPTLATPSSEPIPIPRIRPKFAERPKAKRKTRRRR